jgi:hypothetical protein
MNKAEARTALNIALDNEGRARKHLGMTNVKDNKSLSVAVGETKKAIDAFAVACEVETRNSIVSWIADTPARRDAQENIVTLRARERELMAGEESANVPTKAERWPKVGDRVKVRSAGPDGWVLLPGVVTNDTGPAFLAAKRFSVAVDGRGFWGPYYPEERGELWNFDDEEPTSPEPKTVPADGLTERERGAYSIYVADLKAITMSEVVYPVAWHDLDEDDLRRYLAIYDRAEQLFKAKADARVKQAEASLDEWQTSWKRVEAKNAELARERGGPYRGRTAYGAERGVGRGVVSVALASKGAVPMARAYRSRARSAQFGGLFVNKVWADIYSIRTCETKHVRAWIAKCIYRHC